MFLLFVFPNRVHIHTSSKEWALLASFLAVLGVTLHCFLMFSGLKCFTFYWVLCLWDHLCSQNGCMFSFSMLNVIGRNLKRFLSCLSVRKYCKQQTLELLVCAITKYSSCSYLEENWNNKAATTSVHKNVSSQIVLDSVLKKALGSWENDLFESCVCFNRPDDPLDPMHFFYNDKCSEASGIRWWCSYSFLSCQFEQFAFSPSSRCEAQIGWECAWCGRAGVSQDLQSPCTG